MARPNYAYNPSQQVLQQSMQNQGILWQQPAQYGQNYTGGYGAYTQGMGSLGQSMAGAYGSQAGALAGLANAAAGERSARSGAAGSAESARQGAIGNIANAYAADRGARSGANSAAEASRQGALGNIGSAALGAYGSAAGSALGAWAANQTAYNKSVSDMMAANQASMSQYGTSRNQALGNIAGSYGAAAQGLGQAGATPSTNFSMGAGGFGGGGGGYGDTGFTATGAGGEPIASSTGPSYSGGGGMGGDMSLSGGKYVDPKMFGSVVDPTFRGLDASLMSLDGGGYADRMSGAYGSAANQLDRQHYSSRGQPSQMLGQTLGGLMSLGDQSIGAANNGMDQYYSSNTPGNYGQFLGSSAGGMSQFYGSDNPMNVSGLANSINGGYGDALRGLTSMQGGMTQGFDQNNANLNNLWKQSLGKQDWKFSPWQQAKNQPTNWGISPEAAQYQQDYGPKPGVKGPVGAFGGV
jgi:hypothetical protein